LLYSAFTYYTGFKVNSGEYKLMGLAPYGEPKHASLILDKLIHVNDDGSFWMDQSYFDYCVGLRMTNEKFAALFGQPARRPEKELLTQFHMDVAAPIQAVTEHAVIKLARAAQGTAGVQSVHGRRCRAQLPRQRQAAQGTDLRFDLDPAGGGRCRWGGGCGACRLPPFCGSAADCRAEQALFGIDKLNVPRSSIPAVTHIDYSARVQTVHAETNPRYHALISAFRRLTNCGVVVNTSFNVRGEPIVHTPEDAFRCFMGSDIEVLAVGNCYLRRSRIRRCASITRTASRLD
jgi:predicted NodU family carbamoyl transferase